MLGIDLMKILRYVVLVVEGKRTWQYMSRFPIDEKLSSKI